MCDSKAVTVGCNDPRTMCQIHNPGEIEHGDQREMQLRKVVRT